MLANEEDALFRTFNAFQVRSIYLVLCCIMTISCKFCFPFDSRIFAESWCFHSFPLTTSVDDHLLENFQLKEIVFHRHNWKPLGKWTKIALSERSSSNRIISLRRSHRTGSRKSANINHNGEATKESSICVAEKELGGIMIETVTRMRCSLLINMKINWSDDA